MYKSKFQEGSKVEVAEYYLNDEVMQDFDGKSNKATVEFEPNDDEELVGIIYDGSGDLDFVPQDILELI